MHTDSARHAARCDTQSGVERLACPRFQAVGARSQVLGISSRKPQRSFRDTSQEILSLEGSDKILQFAGDARKPRPEEGPELLGRGRGTDTTLNLL